MLLFFAILVCSVVGFFIHLFVSEKRKTFFRIIELLLLYQLVFNIGILGFLSFLGLTFMPGKVASYLQWATCPFQQELGNANLGFGVLGILSIWIRGHFWTATIIGASIWLFADGLQHLTHVMLYQHANDGNAGILLYSDLLLPVVLLILLAIYLKIRPKTDSR